MNVVKLLGKFVKFLPKYAGEIGLVGATILKIIGGVALNPKDREEVEQAARQLLVASESIGKSLKDVQNLAKEVADLKTIKPTAAEIKAGVEAVTREYLTPDVIENLVSQALDKVLKERQHPKSLEG